MPRLIQVEPRSRYKLWVKYDDDVQGEVDLSDLAGRGVFKAWKEPGRFESVFVGPQGQLSWEDELELCPDAMYLRLTGKLASELFPSLRKAETRA